MIATEKMKVLRQEYSRSRAKLHQSEQCGDEKLVRFYKKVCKDLLIEMVDIGGIEAEAIPGDLK